MRVHLQELGARNVGAARRRPTREPRARRLAQEHPALHARDGEVARVHAHKVEQRAQHAGGVRVVPVDARTRRLHREHGLRHDSRGSDQPLSQSERAPDILPQPEPPVRVLRGDRDVLAKREVRREVHLACTRGEHVLGERAVPWRRCHHRLLQELTHGCKPRPRMQVRERRHLLRTELVRGHLLRDCTHHLQPQRSQRPAPRRRGC